MRSLKTDDLFNATRMLLKIGIRDEIKAVAEQQEKSKGKKIKIDFGVDLFLGILEKATEDEAKKEIYVFFADILETDWETVRDYDPIDLLEQLEKVTSFERWKTFFKRAAKLMPKK